MAIRVSVDEAEEPATVAFTVTVPAEALLEIARLPVVALEVKVGVMPVLGEVVSAVMAPEAVTATVVVPELGITTQVGERVRVGGLVAQMFSAVVSVVALPLDGLIDTESVRLPVELTGAVTEAVKLPEASVGLTGVPTVTPGEFVPVTVTAPTVAPVTLAAEPFFTLKFTV